MNSDDNQESEIEALLEQVKEITTFLFQVSKDYSDSIMEELKPKRKAVVDFEVIIYLFFHLDFSMIKNRIDNDFRKLINVAFNEKLFEFYGRNLFELINDRLTTYGDIKNREGYYTDQYFEEMFFYFEQLLLNAKNNLEPTHWQLGIDKVELLGAWKHYPLRKRIIALEQKFVVPFIKTCNEIFARI